MYRFVQRAAAKRIQTNAMVCVPRAFYSDAQHQAVLASFAKVKAADPTFETQGVSLFSNVFDTAPGAKAIFSFGDKTGAEFDAALRKFSPSTWKAIEKTLGDPSNTDNSSALSKMGAGHVEMGVKAEHFPVVEDALIKTLSSTLGSDWNGDLEAAWRAAYNVVADMIKKDNAF